MDKSTKQLLFCGMIVDVESNINAGWDDLKTKIQNVIITFETFRHGVLRTDPFQVSWQENSQPATGPHMCGGVSSGYKGNDHRALNRK